MADSTVLLRRGALGDVILLGAVTSALRGSVTVACDPRWMPVAERLRGVDRVVEWRAELPSGRVVDLQGGWKGRIAAPRAAARIRKRTLARRIKLWTGLGRGRPTVPELYAETVGVRAVEPPWMDGWQPEDRLALVPGAAWVPKRYAPERFSAVGRAWPGPVVVLGGPGERSLVQDVAGGVPGAEMLVERGFDYTLAALETCRVVVAGDTGLMHLAGALGIPVVALFGPTHPSDGFWVYPGEVVQREGVACRPCALHRVERCRTGDHRCLDIPAGFAIDAVARCAG